jgi:hypothetical protein
MPEKIEKNDSRKSQEPIDLSALEGLTFGPSWSDPKSSIKAPRTERREHRPSHSFQQGKSTSISRDRRPSMNRTHDRSQDRSYSRSAQETFHPTVELSFYPEDEPFLALIKAIRVSCKTYELFELARLILEKPERFVAVINPKRTDKNPIAKLYVCPFDAMPFESEDEALKYALKTHIGSFFDVEEVEVEPPKGSFPIINRCGITGELLGPPNYHRYQDLLKEHYSNNLSNIPYEKFLSKIESVKDEESIKAWTEKMSKAKRYTFKKIPEGEEKSTFNTWEDARAFLLSKHKNELVQEVNSVRFHGALLDKMPRSDIKRSFEVLLKMQRDFPLDTANNIRGRLRRMNLAIYKKGSKGVTYVCAVKRKFRQEGISFSENLQSLVDFIEKHPNCLASKLPELYLGIQQPSTTPVAEGSEASVLTPEQQSQIRKLMLDLRWLISEGYVTEYGNSKLYAPSPVSSGKPLEDQPESQAEPLETHESQASPESSPIEASQVIIESEEASETPVAKKPKKAPARKKATKKAASSEETNSPEQSIATAE